jgi:hypothetical protein
VVADALIERLPTGALAFIVVLIVSRLGVANEHAPSRVNVYSARLRSRSAPR